VQQLENESSSGGREYSCVHRRPGFKLQFNPGFSRKKKKKILSGVPGSGIFYVRRRILLLNEKPVGLLTGIFYIRRRILLLNNEKPVGLLTGIFYIRRRILLLNEKPVGLLTPPSLVLCNS
jgi:hypothetical protein